jgi:hypothetical protein
MRAADPISEGPPLMVARPAMLKRDATEAGHQPGRSPLQVARDAQRRRLLGLPGSVFGVVGTIFVPASPPCWATRW